MRGPSSGAKLKPSEPITALPCDHAVTDHDTIADPNAAVNQSTFADDSVRPDRDMRQDRGLRTDPATRPNYDVGADARAFAERRVRSYHRSRMDSQAAPGRRQTMPSGWRAPSARAR